MIGWVEVFTLSCHYLKPREPSSILTNFWINLGLLIFLASSACWLLRFLFLLQDFLNIDIVLLDIIGDRQNVTGLSTDCVAQLFTFVDILQMLLFKLLIYQEKVVLEITESIGLKISKVSNVIFMFELIAKAEGVECHHLARFILVLIARNVILIIFVVWGAFSHLGSELVFVVADIITSSLPEVGAVFSIALGRIHKWLHANLVAGLILLEVHDIELVLATLSNVSDRKVVPLRMCR